MERSGSTPSNQSVPRRDLLRGAAAAGIATGLGAGLGAGAGRPGTALAAQPAP